MVRKFYCYGVPGEFELPTWWGCTSGRTQPHGRRTREEYCQSNAATSHSSPPLCEFESSYKIVSSDEVTQPHWAKLRWWSTSAPL